MFGVAEIYDGDEDEGHSCPGLGLPIVSSVAVWSVGTGQCSNVVSRAGMCAVQQRVCLLRCAGGKWCSRAFFVVKAGVVHVYAGCLPNHVYFHFGARDET